MEANRKRTEELLEKYLLLKVDTIHNTITTHRIVEKIYSIDDIEAYCDKYPNDTELGREIRKLRYKQQRYEKYIIRAGLLNLASL